METEKWIIEKLAVIIAVDPTEMNSGTRFDEDVECDSIDLIEVLNTAEDEFGIEIDEELLYDVVTVGGLAKVVDDARKAA